MPEEAGRALGLLESIKALARTLLAAAQTRLELAASDLEEQRALLLHQLLLSVIAVFCLGLAIVFAALFFVLWFPDDQRALVIGLFALLFFAVTAALYALVRQTAKERPKMFSTTIAELEKDRQSLQ